LEHEQLALGVDHEFAKGMGVEHTDGPLDFDKFLEKGNWTHEQLDLSWQCQAESGKSG